MIDLMRATAFVTAAISIGTLSNACAGARTVGPSFNCRDASYADERLICSDDRLAEMDRLGSTAMAAIKDRGLIKYLRHALSDDRKDRHACGTNKLCIVDNQARVVELFNANGAGAKLPVWLGAYRLRLVAHGAAEMVQGVPKRIGTCTWTRIKSVAGAISSDEAGVGSSVIYANDEIGTSYGFEPGLADAAVGDKVLMCLASVPRNCPPSDGRGREYAATDLRTMASWVLPDARHRCGGA